MTTAARMFLSGGEQGASLLQQVLPESQWRRRWLTVLALLRAIGHVLDKVDGAASPALRSAINQWWQEVKIDKEIHPIFWEFVEQERNSVLKTYRWAICRQVLLQAAPIELDFSKSKVIEVPLLPPQELQAIASGRFKNWDPVLLASEAIGWWAAQLARVDELAKSAP